MESTITDHAGFLLARIEADDYVFEVNAETVEPTDVTLRFRRDGDVVGSICNDDGTDRTIARLTTAREAGTSLAFAFRRPSFPMS